MISRYVCRYIRGETPMMAVVSKSTTKSPFHQKRFYSTPMMNPHLQFCNNVLLGVKNKDFMDVFLDEQSPYDFIPTTVNDFVNIAQMMNMSAVVVLEVHTDHMDKEDNLYEIYYFQKKHVS
jgi:hypothetical protein